ncbi:ATP-binding protein [Nocardioides nitrophenolicus]|uniref:ATP-binding protein n=1 Tax=Nocardioides nitrophenolicus TaxID=60489 RepID=UPI00195BAFD6|nr:ATP-binding protein [Nocardioides nitrophenolicus]MBM7516243.1 putative AAA+ superfamily ATPase [Nocardioides nitrophenolicus]
MSALVGRHLLETGGAYLETFPALVVQGARQVGKSTFAGLLAADRPSLTLTLDDQQVRDAVVADPAAFIEQLPDGLLVVDEIQRAPELILAVKAAIDRNRRPGRFVLTGSSDLLRLERTPDSLAGRAVSIQLRGLSQGELAGRREDFVAALASGATPLGFRTGVGADDYAGRIARGGYPEVRELRERLRPVWFDSYLERIVQRDARELVRLPEPERLASLLRLIAANQSGELVKARLAEAAGLPATSIAAYVDLLRTLYLVDLLPPWTPNLTRREIGKPKSIVADPGLALRLARLAEGQIAGLAGRDALGPQLEGFVVAELLKQRGWSECAFDLYHYRDRNGLEVDVIIELEDGRVFGVEVKAARSYRRQQFAGLEGIAARLGDRFAGGVVLTTAQDGYQYRPGMWGLPVAALWEWPDAP